MSLLLFSSLCYVVVVSYVNAAWDTPIALHQLVVVNTTGNSLIRLKSYDELSNKVSYYLQTASFSGIFYQLSQVFRDYGYSPIGGSKFPANSYTKVTDPNDRIYYTSPSGVNPSSYEKLDSVQFFAQGLDSNGDSVTSREGTVTLVSSSGFLTGDSFLLDNGGWTISGNKQSTSATFEPYTRGALLNHYILGTDDKINTDESGVSDASLWYFEAPQKYLTNLGIAYGGSLEFTLGSFSGDFSRLNSDSVNVIELECASCAGPVSMGVTLGFSLTSLKASTNGPFTGSVKRFSIPLVEGSLGGWKKDSQNSLLPWTTASQCDIIQVLSRLSRIRVLGDWTNWYESVAMDDFRFKNLKGQLPLCAMQRPDASICTC